MNQDKSAPATERLLLSISVQRRTYQPGDFIELTFSLRNGGGAPAPLVLRSPWIDYGLVVRRNGQDLQRNEFAEQQIEAGSMGRRATWNLDPGKSLTESLELSKGYALSTPGEYSVVATREVYAPGRMDQFMTLKSNELRFKVEPERR